MFYIDDQVEEDEVVGEIGRWVCFDRIACVKEANYFLIPSLTEFDEIILKIMKVFSQMIRS